MGGLAGGRTVDWAWGGKKRGGGSAEGGEREEDGTVEEKRESPLMCKALRNKCSYQSCPKTDSYKRGQTHDERSFPVRETPQQGLAIKELVPAAQPPLCYYSLWEEPAEELRVMSLSHVWMTSVGGSQRIGISVIQRG